MIIQIYDKAKYKQFSDAKKRNDYRTLPVPDGTDPLLVDSLISTVQEMCQYKTLVWFIE